MKAPVSVVIPLYQKAQYVDRCLDSVAAQTCAAHEVIVVDDGSTDGGAERVLARRDPRVRLIRQPHAGEGAARNRGLGEAACAWVALLDADDAWQPAFLETVVGLTSANEGLVAAFTNVLDGSSGQVLLSASHRGLLDDYFSFALAHGGLGLTASSTLVHRQAMQACGGFRSGVPLGADTDAWARLAWSGPVGYAPEVMAVYYPGLPGSATVLGRRAPPSLPVTVASYRAWWAAGRIPPRLLESSSRFVDALLLDHCITLINRGLRREAWRVLRDECWPRSRWNWRYGAAVLRLLLPRSLHMLLRRRLGRGATAECARGPQSVPRREEPDAVMRPLADQRAEPADAVGSPRCLVDRARIELATS